MKSRRHTNKPIDGTADADARVRQRLVSLGAEVLSDAELLSIVMRDGGRDGSALELAEAVLGEYGGCVNRLRDAGLGRLRMLRGMGLGRAAVVAAALELGRRIGVGEVPAVDYIHNNDDVVALFRPLIGDLPYEEFWVVYLNTSNRILDRVKIGQGGVDGLSVDTRLVIKRALDRFAVSVILVHNHPSGSPSPGDSDLELTRRLRAAAELFDIRVLDHVVVTRGVCFSFRGEGLL